jgi:hypothetical protein
MPEENRNTYVGDPNVVGVSYSDYDDNYLLGPKAI